MSQSGHSSNAFQFEHRIMLFLASTALLAANTVMMAKFLGSGSTDVTGLNSLLGVWCLLAPLWLLVTFVRLPQGSDSKISSLWQSLAIWARLFGAGAALLALLAILAIVMIGRITGSAADASEFVPAIAALVSVGAAWTALAVIAPARGTGRFSGPKHNPAP
ncbi:MAG: hypothetical protein AAF385_15790 [Pseudomonadota bacterium]